MSDTYSKLLIHVVFSTRNRAKDLDAAVRDELYRYLAELLKEKGCRPLAIGGGLDHVHLLFALPPVLSVSDLMRFLKANSSRWIREKFSPHLGWQAGYAAFSVSESNREAVCSYVEGQEKRHKRTSFEDEFVSLLKRNEIEFENERLWSPGRAE